VKETGINETKGHEKSQLISTQFSPGNSAWKTPVRGNAGLYFQRWDVELFFRDIKTTMGMDILRCKSPGMVRKVLLMHFIVYNCLQLLTLKAADNANLPVRMISFKTSIQALRQWEPLLKSEMNSQEPARLLSLLCDSIASSVIQAWPGQRA
jgi:hypothetical protein